MASKAIEINFQIEPAGQVGGPAKMKVNDTFHFVQLDKKGEIKMSFIGDSPLGPGAPKELPPGETFKVVKPGRFPFKCTWTVDGKVKQVVGDIPVPGKPGGGEIVVGNSDN